MLYQVFIIMLNVVKLCVIMLSARPDPVRVLHIWFWVLQWTLSVVIHSVVMLSVEIKSIMVTVIISSAIILDTS